MRPHRDGHKNRLKRVFCFLGNNILDNHCTNCSSRGALPEILSIHLFYKNKLTFLNFNTSWRLQCRALPWRWIWSFLCRVLAGCRRKARTALADTLSRTVCTGWGTGTFSCGSTPWSSYSKLQGVLAIQPWLGKGGCSWEDSCFVRWISSLINV